MPRVDVLNIFNPVHDSDQWLQKLRNKPPYLPLKVLRLDMPFLVMDFVFSTKYLSLVSIWNSVGDHQNLFLYLTGGQSVACANVM